MPEIICPRCKTINKCPSCTDYACVVCGEDLEGKEKMKTKLEEWRKFSAKVENHVSDYCLTQYGDYPDEEIDEWTVSDIKAFLHKYVRRIDKGARGADEERRDALKIAHYGCYLLSKLEVEDG